MCWVRVREWGTHPWHCVFSCFKNKKYRKPFDPLKTKWTEANGKVLYGKIIQFYISSLCFPLFLSLHWDWVVFGVLTHSDWWWGKNITFINCATSPSNPTRNHSHNKTKQMLHATPDIPTNVCNMMLLSIFFNINWFFLFVFLIFWIKKFNFILINTFLSFQ